MNEEKTINSKQEENTEEQPSKKAWITPDLFDLSMEDTKNSSNPTSDLNFMNS